MGVTQSLQTEDIAWAAYDRLSGALGSALVAVQARRTRNPLTLLPPVSISMGYDDTTIELAANQFPRVAIIAAPRTPEDEGANERITIATHTLLIEWIVFVSMRAGVTTHTLKHEVTLIGWRYGEAILDTMMKGRSYAGFSPTNAAPTVDEGQAVPIRLNRNSSDLSGFIAGGMITIPLRGKYVF